MVLGNSVEATLFWIPEKGMLKYDELSKEDREMFKKFKV